MTAKILPFKGPAHPDILTVPGGLQLSVSVTVTKPKPPPAKPEK
jgi:hypothetical protein